MLRLKQLRMEKGLKQTELCKILNVSQGTLSSWENGRYEIDQENLKKICDFFHVTSDYLLGLSPRKNSFFIPEDLRDKQFAFNGFDLTGLTEDNIEDLRLVAERMRKRNLEKSKNDNKD